MIITDILLQKNDEGVYDISLDESGNLVADSGYSNALLISFGTNARADASEVANSENREGWWGDQFSPAGTPNIGSKLWILRTLPVDDVNLNKGIAYLQSAYSWLVREQRATKTEVTGAIIKNESQDIGYRFEITISNGSDKITTKTFELWSDTVAS